MNEELECVIDKEVRDVHYWQRKGVGMAQRTDNPCQYYNTFREEYDSITRELGSARTMKEPQRSQFIHDKWCTAYERTFKGLGIER